VTERKRNVMEPLPNKNLTTSTPPVRIGIVGCGGITREAHLPSILATPGLKVTCLCDAKLRNATLTNAEFRLGAAVVSTPGELAGLVDAAVVAVPPRFHAPVTIDLLKHRIGVLCEKPLATSVADGRQMLEAADSAGLVLAVGFQQRFHPNNQLLRDVLASDWLGEIQEVNAEFGGVLDGFLGAPTYVSRAMTGGGVLFDMGIHLVDRVTWLFGELREITLEDDSYGGIETNANLGGQLTIHGKCVPCSMAFSWTHRLSNRIFVRGSKAAIEVRIAEPTLARLRCDLAGHQRTLVLEAEEVPANFTAHTAQMQDFAAAVRERRPPLVSGQSTLRSLEVIEQAYRVRRRLSQPWVETWNRA